MATFKYKMNYIKILLLCYSHFLGRRVVTNGNATITEEYTRISVVFVPRDVPFGSVKRSGTARLTTVSH